MITADVVAVGAGPANLSLLALAAPLDSVDVTVLEQEDIVEWHPGLLFDESRLQISPVKDLVSLVDPMSRYSFLNFLREEGRIYRHLIANSGKVSRREFSQYYAWAANQLGVKLGQKVIAIDHDGTSFVVKTETCTSRARNLVLGVGQAPRTPAMVAGLPSERVWHASNHLRAPRDLTGKRVMVVGAGQSAAEISYDLLCREGGPDSLIWVCGPRGLVPVDDSPFSNDWSNPSYVEFFRDLEAERRETLLSQQKSAYSGISQDLLDRIYRRLYDLDYLGCGTVSHQLLTSSRLTALEEQGQALVATVHDATTGAARRICVDVVILATGYSPSIPDFLNPLLDRLDLVNGGYRVGADYQISWDGPVEHKIFVQNAARSTHGIADPNVSLAAWRSAVILNSITGRRAYHLVQHDVTMQLS